MEVTGGEPCLLTSLLCPHCQKTWQWDLHQPSSDYGFMRGVPEPKHVPVPPLSLQGKPARGRALVATSASVGSFCREIWPRLCFFPLPQTDTELMVDSFYVSPTSTLPPSDHHCPAGSPGCSPDM